MRRRMGTVAFPYPSRIGSFDGGSNNILAL
jgi:hypothetical protein